MNTSEQYRLGSERDKQMLKLILCDACANMEPCVSVRELVLSALMREKVLCEGH